jgi:hypothetical protein
VRHCIVTAGETLDLHTQRRLKQQHNTANKAFRCSLSSAHHITSHGLLAMRHVRHAFICARAAATSQLLRGG